MSVINNAHPGSHIASLIFIDRLLNRKIKNGVPEFVLLEDILTRYRPEHLFRGETKEDNGEFKFLKNPHRKLKESLNFWSDLGLWQKSDDKIRAKDQHATDFNFPSRLCECIFDRKIDVIDGNGIEPLIRSMALFLSLNQYTLVGNNLFKPTEISSIASKFFPSESENQTRLSINSSETGVLSEYGLLLGFFEKVDKSNLTVDPTRLYEPFIKKVLSNETAKGGILIKDFLNALGKEIPVVDGGEYRELIENLIANQQREWTKPPSHQLSASLSIALHRLKIKRLINLENRSDTESIMDMILPGNVSMPISHIRLGEV